VQLSSTGIGNSVTQPAGTTDSGGVASGSISSTVAEGKTITVTLNPGPSQIVLSSQPLLTFVGDSSNLSASQSSASASPETGLVADGSDASSITVTVRDGNGNPVAGQTVQISSNGTGNSITQPVSPTDANGTASASMASTTAETKTITVTLNPGPSQVVLSDQPTVNFDGDPSNLSAGLSTAVASPSSGLLANGSDSSTITVTVLDGNDNPVAGQSVQIASDGSNNTIIQSGLSDASGVASGTIASTTAETKTITVTINPGPSQVVLTQQPTVGFVGDASSISASNSSAVASPSSGISADGLASSTITVTVRDNNGNPIPGQTVQLSATGSGNAITQPVAITDANGVTSGSLTSTVAEIKTISAVVNPGPSQVMVDQQPRIAFDSLLDLDDGRLIYGESTVAAAHQRDWLAGSSTWGAEGSTAGGATEILWTQNRISPIGWFGDNWTRRKQISVQASMVSGVTDLQNFPLLVSLDDADLAAAALANGDDLLFTAANGTTKLAHEIESYAAGILVAWVKLPILSAAEDTSIYLYYGNSGASNQENAAAVWSEDYAAVWHLGGSYSGTPGEVIDSSGSGNHGQAGTAPTQSTGRIGMGQDFESGSAQYLQVDHGGALDFAGAGSQFTISAWLRPESLGAWQAIFSKGAASPFDQWLGLDNTIPGIPGFELDSSILAANSTLSAGAWTHLAFTWDHVDMRVHLNGVLDGSSLGRALDLSDSSDTSFIGAMNAGAGDPLDGILDELRISSLVRSSEWLATEHANQSDPSSFYSLGSEEDFASDAGEELMAVLSDTGAGSSLDYFSGSNGSWSLDWNSTDLAQTEADKRGFALVYEDASGEALAVYSNDSSTPRFRTRTGGTWSSAQPLPINDGAGHNPDPNTGTVLWVELASRPGTDEIALLYLDANRDLIALIWDGAQWLTNTVAVLETAMKINASSGELSNRNFDLAYVEQSGQLMTAWSRESTTGFWYSTREAGSSSWSTASHVSNAPNGGIVHFVDLAAEPQGSRIAGAFFDMGDGTERLGLATWDGSSWLNPGEYDSQTRNVNDSAIGDFFGAVAWVGTSGKAICVYSDNNSGEIDWASWTSGAGWAIETDIPIAGKGFTESVLLHSYRGQDRILLLISDSANDLWSASYDGSSWTLENSGAALETDLSGIDSRPFSFSLKRH
jgi:protocatechuate 3,4-dioxygenase beta subunit